MIERTTANRKVSSSDSGYMSVGRPGVNPALFGTLDKVKTAHNADSTILSKAEMTETVELYNISHIHRQD